MSVLNVAHVLSPTLDPLSPPLVLGASPANESRPSRVLSLDQLAAHHGAPNPVFTRVAFGALDPEASLALGRKVATTRILDSIPAFVQDVDSIANMLPTDYRELLVGYAPELLPVLVAETVTLREYNTRYDRGASLDATARAQVLTRDEAVQVEGRRDYGQMLRVVRLYLAASTRESFGFDRLPEGGGEGDDLQRALDAMADRFDAWWPSVAESERPAYAALGLSDKVVTRLRARARAVRDSQAEVVGLTDRTRITQRQLDEQDGRVLHLVGVIVGAFRQGARRLPNLPMPTLGELESWFVRDRRATDDGKGAEPPTPDAPAAPVKPA
jgi:hypothetical protein